MSILSDMLNNLYGARQTSSMGSRMELKQLLGSYASTSCHTQAGISRINVEACVTPESTTTFILVRDRPGRNTSAGVARRLG